MRIHNRAAPLTPGLATSPMNPKSSINVRRSFNNMAASFTLDNKGRKKFKRKDVMFNSPTSLAGLFDKAELTSHKQLLDRTLDFNKINSGGQSFRPGKAIHGFKIRKNLQNQTSPLSLTTPKGVPGKKADAGSNSPASRNS